MKHSEEDRALLDELEAALAEADATPQRIREAGYAAFAWRTFEQELADLLYDSARQADVEAAGIRAEIATAALRTLGFSGAGIEVDLELHRDRLLGQLTPADVDEVLVETQDGEAVTADVDELGCFEIARMSPGTFRLRLTVQGRSIVTPWVSR